LGYSAREVADVLETTEANVRIAHLRARRALADYEARPRVPMTDLADATARVLGEFIACLRQGDAAGLEKLIAESARVVTDAGGEFNAERTPLRGRERAMNFHLRIARRRGASAVPQPCSLNGLP